MALFSLEKVTKWGDDGVYKNMYPFKLSIGLNSFKRIKFIQANVKKKYQAFNRLKFLLIIIGIEPYQKLELLKLFK